MTNIRSDKVTFPGAHGVDLAARLDLPVTGAPHAFALFAHCFTCSKDMHAATRISRALAALGIAVLRFDFTGLGRSEGEFANTNFSGNVDDLVAAAGWLRGTHQAPALLVGHSLGGAAALAVAALLPEVQAVATINAPCDPAHLLQTLPTADQPGVARLGGRDFTITRQFIEDLNEQTLLKTVHGLKKALLIFHAPRDEVVGLKAAERLYDAAMHPKSFVSLDDADHLLSDRADAAYVAEVLAAWASRYLGGRPRSHLAREPMPHGSVLAEESHEGRFTLALQAGQHLVTADEPVDLGGNDLGPSPYELLSSALAACTAMTIRMYAERKGLPLRHVAVRVTHEKVHAEDVSAQGKIDRFAREIELEGDLDMDQEARLVEIADRCPVHRTLHSEILVTTRLKD